MDIRICYQNSDRRSVCVFILKHNVRRGRGRTDNFATIINYSTRGRNLEFWEKLLLFGCSRLIHDLERRRR